MDEGNGTNNATRASQKKIIGAITKQKYQEAFKASKEATSSESTFGLDYTIWKAMALSDHYAEFQCMMMSLPYMFGFKVNR